MSKLYTLKADNCKITDISALKGKNISTISMSENTIKDISALAGNKSLHTLETANPNLDLENLKEGDVVCVPRVNLPCALPGSAGLEELGGGGKMHSLRTSNASVYASFEDKDWQTLFTPEGVSEVPVRFEAFEDGEYTFNWETYHGDFSYLHLIDNLAGKDIDCLSATEYKFEGKTTDYHSRFKLVFQCTGVEENLDDATTVNFAFQREDELIVNGEGQLEMFDITGRRLMDTQAVGEQSHYSLPKVAAGVYLLRLSSNQQVKIQKIILQ